MHFPCRFIAGPDTPIHYSVKSNRRQRFGFEIASPVLNQFPSVAETVVLISHAHLTELSSNWKAFGSTEQMSN
jgi:hypothetical protein